MGTSEQPAATSVAAPSGTAPSPAGGGAAAEATSARRSRLSRLRAAGDRVPTKWFAGIGTAAFLVATAAFGGLNAVAAPALPVLAAGETHTNELYALAVEKGFLFDELPGSGAYPADDEQIVALRVRFENVWTAPESTGTLSSMPKMFALSVPDATFASTVRIDDETLSPWLQPGVPAVLALVWTVPRGALTDGDEVIVTISDLSLHTGSFVASGRWWTDPQEAATVALPIEYLAGAE